MVVLNLVDLDNSEIKYQIQRFPDGQQNVVILDEGLGGNFWDLNPRGGKKTIQIKARLNNWSDLELIVCTVASLRILKVKEIHLYVPYILGARSDRKFETGGNRYIKDVIAPILNSLNFESVTCIDPHSYVLENCINNFESKTNVELVKYATLDLYGPIAEKGPNSSYPCILISPDAGASHKIYKLAEQIGYKGDIITCSKERDKNGKIVKTIVPILPYTDKDIIIIDDICDGGVTFINIAKEIKNIEGFNGKIYLIVTHGIFSKGFQELYEYFDGIYCTNSYADVENCVKGTYALANGGPIVKDWVKQLNVF